MTAIADTHQSEAELEAALMKQLQGAGYEPVSLPDEAALLANLRKQLFLHNEEALGGNSFTELEFEKVLNHLNKGTVFDRAKTLRDKFALRRDDGTVSYIEFLQQEKWCQNRYQVTHQITMTGNYTNRYDVTLLINGLPLVQIELKRRGMELKEAFNQVNRYHKHSYDGGVALFLYVQIFVISNGVNTKYYANNRHQHFKQTFYWTDEQNNYITNLDAFAAVFLEKCHISKMICRSVVLHESNKILMVLRPYQYYAVEAIEQRVKDGCKNGYIWHTTGSGKTLTSFKASQVLEKMPKVHKILFVVDRNDLDYQTMREFNEFSPDSVDATDNTRTLVKQLAGDTRLIVTTLQKLNHAIKKPHFLKRIEHLQDKRIIFIFDECHRSQFGDTHHRIKQFFTRNQMFGFTGTPIFRDNAATTDKGKRTTKDLFGEALHKYVITNAIKDENVLRFSIEYLGRYKKKDSRDGELDIEVEGIDTQELLQSHERVDVITDYIIANHNRKTHDRDYSAILCVSSIPMLTRYYDIFKAKKDAGLHDLRIATIFTYAANEEADDADGFIRDTSLDVGEGEINEHSRDMLERYIADYNAMYGTNFSTESKQFQSYFKNIAKRLKEREKKSFKDKDRLDILLVVNMFLTGFDAKTINTLYVDKNLKYHGLVQAFSRTNRILGEKKSHGNIVCFRNLKKATDDAIKLFSNMDAKETILLEPYEDYVKQFNEGVKKLRDITPTVDSVNELRDEDTEMHFVKVFRQLVRLKNTLSGFSDFTFANLDMTAQEFEDYKSKYLDIFDKVRGERSAEKVSILHDVDFELELIQRDDINVAYILSLLEGIEKDSDVEKKAKRKAALDLVSGEPRLRSKRELIEKFIDQHVLVSSGKGSIQEKFEEFWNIERSKAFKELCEQEGLNSERVKEIVDNYMYSQRKPLRDTIVSSLIEKPKILKRDSIIQHVSEKIMSFIHLFEDATG